MGLLKSELEKVPADLDEKDCYQLIRTWLIEHGIDYAEENASKTQSYFCEKFTKRLPVLANSTRSGREYIFLLIIAGPLEIFYHQRDSSGIKIAAYAHHSLNLKYQNAYPIKKINETAKNSIIYKIEKKLNKELKEMAAKPG